MSGSARLSVATLGCLRAVRSFLINDGLWTARSSFQQTRGKKYDVRQPRTVKVKLLRDIETYGAQGAVIPVAPGRMRNIWYPAKLARYMTQAQLEILGKEKIRRYFDFRLAKEDSDSRNTVSVPESGATPRTSVKLQKSDVAFEILSKLLPAKITFHRTPLVPQTARKPNNKAGLKAAIEDNLQEAAIYGSVTRIDIVNAIKTLLKEDERGANIVLGAEDVAIVSRQGRNFGVESDRVKALGNFTIEIRIKGEEPIRRTVNVKEQINEKAQQI